MATYEGTDRTTSYASTLDNTPGTATRPPKRLRTQKPGGSIAH